MCELQALASGKACPACIHGPAFCSAGFSMPCSSLAQCPISRTNSRNGCGRSCRVYRKFPIGPWWHSGSPTNLAILQPVPRSGASACRRAQQQCLCVLAHIPRNPGQRGFGEGNFDPATGQQVTSRDTLGGEFFYRFHFQFHYMPVVWGRWLAGAAAMFMLVAIVSGVITHKKIFVDFFTFRWGKRQRSWLDAHNSLSVFGLPFIS